jgi:protein-disulfide isomerase
VLIGSYYYLWSGNTSNELDSMLLAEKNDSHALQLMSENQNLELTNVSSILVDDIVLGDPNAPVTIIEYASFTCPHCKNFHEGTFKKLKQNYINTGKVKFILRDVYFDRYGLWAAMVARCDNSNRFYGIVDEIFRKQSEWTDGAENIDIANNLRKIGLAAGMDNEKISVCLNDGDMAQALVDVYQTNVERDQISSTPSFLINGEKMNKSSYSEFVLKIDEHIKGY